MFLSAGQRQMDALEQHRLLLPGSQRLVARNALALPCVAVASRLDLRSPQDLGRAEVQRVVLGNPKPCPRASMPRSACGQLGLWETLQSKFIFAENVRQVLKYVARGEVDAGFVYTTDLLSRPGAVKEVAALPSPATPPSPIPGRWVAPRRRKSSHRPSWTSS